MKVNYQSDFKVLLSFFSDISLEYKCEPLECDWTADFFTTCMDKVYRVSNIGGVMTNCSIEDGNIYAVFDKYDLAPGSLRVLFDMKIPNREFQEDIQRLSFKKRLDIMLVEGVGDGLTLTEMKFIIPFVKGDPFTFDDFTPEQLEALRGKDGAKGDPFTYDDFTPEQLEALRGKDGAKGDPFTFDDFTPEQLEALRGPKGEDSFTNEYKDILDNPWGETIE